MKSNASATNTRMMSVSELMGGKTPFRPRRAAESRILEHDTLNDVRDVLTAVGDRLQMLVDRAQLDELAHVGLVAEQTRDGRAHDVVGLRLETVDIDANRKDRGGIVHAGKHRHGGFHLVAAG